MSDWITTNLKRARALTPSNSQTELTVKLIDTVYNRYASVSNAERRIALAAAFDLLVAAEYYKSVVHEGWIYCSLHSPQLFYPYTNVCPRCVLSGRFEFAEARKPSSGIIGNVTANLLVLFFQTLLHRKNHPMQVLRSAEPVDGVFIDNTTSPKTVIFVEIKSSPLITLPLSATSDLLTVRAEEDSPRAVGHEYINHHRLYGDNLSIWLPNFEQPIEGYYYELGAKQDKDNHNWAYLGIMSLLERDPLFFENYVSFWKKVFEAYALRNAQIKAYWLTNGCGQPVPRPIDWPKRRIGSGYESISDGKTSVGLDRTDDIKKSVYQILKLGSLGKSIVGYDFYVGILSNIHPVRHFDEYFLPIIDVIWTTYPDHEVKTVADLPDDHKLYNLFDIILCLTENMSKISRLNSIFDF
ncbi:MAG: hypothetical protein HC876_08920 [Chloroflexaceae bacterium]|nr:hypothetical protein [Chloroflexaceae bacterium]